MVPTTCAHCANSLMVEEKYLTKNVLCPHCHKMFVPPLPLSGMGILSCVLGVIATLILIFILVCRLLEVEWGETSVFTAQQINRFVGFLGVLLSWMGIGCGVAGYTQKQRRIKIAKWGMIINALPNLFCVGYMAAYPWIR